MRNPGTPFNFLLCALLSLLILQSSFSASHIVGAEKYFDYDEDSEFGPQHWGDLDPDWATCKDGKSQSPINITHKNIEVNLSLGSLMTSYHSTFAIMQNRGYDIMINWTEGATPGAGSLLIDGKDYVLQQCHWHSPSEHKFFDEGYPLELHMVHISSDGSIAVIGILYQHGSPDPFLSELWKYLECLIRKQKDEVVVGYLSPPPIENRAPYYRYSGSLTTPPCTENVTWILLREVRTVSEGQVYQLREAVHGDNARPIQPINGRKVYLYKPWIHEDHASS
ncbi:alpha carbonic anhydrase 7-like isoform X2 [Phoenix dactylifera]|uniref:Alpha carbonic anhydrase 7-like isoform X2 n=1 Tax=Phoenix dactylifera TaxID=42345 RepID=A0A8B7MTG5_PHODC|nr:alpha carbonic anhydrase 7-like isoform X2 [Phoenix dactylifera]